MFNNNLICIKNSHAIDSNFLRQTISFLLFCVPTLPSTTSNTLDTIITCCHHNEIKSISEGCVGISDKIWCVHGGMAINCVGISEWLSDRLVLTLFKSL